MMFRDVGKQLRRIYGSSIGIHRSSSTIEKIQTNIGVESDTVDIMVVIHEIFNIANLHAHRK